MHMIGVARNQLIDSDTKLIIYNNLSVLISYKENIVQPKQAAVWVFAEAIGSKWNEELEWSRSSVATLSLFTLLADNRFSWEYKHQLDQHYI